MNSVFCSVCKNSFSPTTSHRKLKWQKYSLGYRKINILDRFYCKKRTLQLNIIFRLYFTGSIPLRHLVYRVHPLPESMRPLVWDFGQLTHHTEELYTVQIVRRFMVSPTPGVSNLTHQVFKQLDKLS